MDSDEEEELESDADDEQSDGEFEVDEDEAQEDQREEDKYSRGLDRQENGRKTTWYPNTRNDVYDQYMNSDDELECGRCDQPIDLDKHGKETGDTGGLKRPQQPPLGHKMDHVLLREGIDNGSLSDMSDNEREQFGVFCDNDTDNLRPEHFNCNSTAKKLHASDYPSKKGATDKYLKAQRVEFKGGKTARSKEAQKRRLKRKLNQGVIPLTTNNNNNNNQPPPPSGGGMPVTV